MVSHINMRYVSYMNKSCHTHKCNCTCARVGGTGCECFLRQRTYTYTFPHTELLVHVPPSKAFDKGRILKKKALLWTHSGQTM